MSPAAFTAGDRVVRLRKEGDKRNYWESGVVVMVVPAGVSPYAMWRRWFRSSGGTCHLAEAREPLMHKERYIVRAMRNGKACYYCPCEKTIAKEPASGG